MDFAVLGPLRVTGPDGPIELPAAKQRSLLAMLLLSHRETAVSSTRLIDALWGEDPPATATKAMQVYISQLRRALGGDTIVTRAPGYAINIDPHQLDLARFEALVARASDGAARAGGRHAPGRAEPVPRPARWPTRRWRASPPARPTGSRACGWPRSSSGSTSTSSSPTAATARSSPSSRP